MNATVWGMCSTKLQLFSLEPGSPSPPCARVGEPGLPHAHAQGYRVKWLVLSICSSSKITRFKESGILMVGKPNHIVGSGEKLFFFCFLTVDTRHECYKSCDYVGHAYGVLNMHWPWKCLSLPFCCRLLTTLGPCLPCSLMSSIQFWLQAQIR